MLSSFAEHFFYFGLILRPLVPVAKRAFTAGLEAIALLAACAALAFTKSGA